MLRCCLGSCGTAWHSRGFGCCEVSTEAGKAMSIDRLITFDQDNANVTQYLLQLVHSHLFQLVEGLVVLW